MPRGRLSPVSSLKTVCLLVGGLLAGVAWSADQAPATAQDADWEQRLGRATELQRSAAARKAAAEKLLEEQSAGCYRKFLVNRCLDEAQGEYLEAFKDARRLANEGKAIERQVKKEQFSAREAKWAAEIPTREADLRARETETAATRAEAEAAEAATRASKARKAEDAERLRRKQADHEARVAAQVEKTNAKAAASAPAKP